MGKPKLMSFETREHLKKNALKDCSGGTTYLAILAETLFKLGEKDCAATARRIRRELGKLETRIAKIETGVASEPPEVKRSAS